MRVSILLTCGKQFEILFDNIFEYIRPKFQIRMSLSFHRVIFHFKEQPFAYFLRRDLRKKDFSLRKPSNACTSEKIRLEVSPCLLCGGYYIDTKAAMEWMAVVRHEKTLQYSILSRIVCSFKIWYRYACLLIVPSYIMMLWRLCLVLNISSCKK